MSKSHGRRIGRKAAEQLLDGSTGPGASPDQLARVLAAAAAAGRESELSGEQAAMTAFEAHHLVPVPASRRGQMIKSPLAKLLTVKVLAISVAAFATGGVALAASDGALNGAGSPGHVVSQPASPASPGGIAAVPSGPGASAPAMSPSASASARPTAPGGTVPGNPPVAGGAAGLCRTLAARADPAAVGGSSAARLEQALASSRVTQLAGGSLFTSLVAIAHGAANVPDYCGLLLGLPQVPHPGDLAHLPAPVLSKALAQLPAGTLAQILTALPAAELSQILTALPVSGLSSVLTTLPAGALAQVLTSLPAASLSQVLTALPAATLSQVLTTLPAADRSPILTSLPASVRSRLLGELPKSVLSQLPVLSGLLG